MRTRFYNLLFTIVFLFVIENGYGQFITEKEDRDQVLVEVREGWLEGEILDLATGDGQYYSFKGIPYAAPPVGKLRFLDPQPVRPWKGIREAKTHGPECIQSISKDNDTLMSEDCLYLNIYTRNISVREHERRPVMLFIHGGGFLTGSGNDKLYGPDFLLAHDVVVVTINYRLDALGFLCLNSREVPGNAGLKDQVAALRWVVRNIWDFGGSTVGLTLVGESSGAASVGYHVFSKMSEGFFGRAILMSGVPLNDWALPYHPVKRAFVLGKLLGKDTNDTTELLEFLQSVPAEKIVDKKPYILASEEFNANIFKQYHYTAVLEENFGQERFLYRSIPDMLRDRSINFVDILIGHTDEESLIDTNDLVDVYAKVYDRYPELLVPTKIQIKSNPDTVLEAAEKIRKFYFGHKGIDESTIKEFSRYITDSGFVYDVNKFASKLADTTYVKVLYYIFSCYSDRNLYGKRGEKYGMRGAAHMDDLAYMFNPKEYNLKIDKNSKEYKMIQSMTSLFTNFARYGNPTPDSSLEEYIYWPTFNSTTQPYLEIGERLVKGERYKADIIEFWDRVYREAGVEVYKDPKKERI